MLVFDLLLAALEFASVRHFLGYYRVISVVIVFLCPLWTTPQVTSHYATLNSFTKHYPIH